MAVDHSPGQAGTELPQDAGSSRGAIRTFLSRLLHDRLIRAMGISLLLMLASIAILSATPSTAGVATAVLEIDQGVSGVVGVALAAALFMRRS